MTHLTPYHAKYYAYKLTPRRSEPLERIAPLVVTDNMTLEFLTRPSQTRARER